MSNYYLQYHQDFNGDLVDVTYFHRFCAPESLKALGDCPCPEWPDYDVYCEECKELIHKGVND